MKLDCAVISSLMVVMVNLMMMMMIQLSNGQTIPIINGNGNSNVTYSNPTYSKPPFPGFFIFGDSLVDVGNNNFIISVAKANQLPFGVDFPSGPTGRFCNGKTVLDVIGIFIYMYVCMYVCVASTHPHITSV